MQIYNLGSKTFGQFFNVNPVFHWEFKREDQLNEFSEVETALRHE